MVRFYSHRPLPDDAMRIGSDYVKVRCFTQHNASAPCVSVCQRPGAFGPLLN